MQQDNQPTTDSALDKSPFQQVIPGILQQSLYPSLAALGTSINTAITPPMSFSRRVINDIEEKQRKALEDTVEGIVRSTNTSPILEIEEQAEEAIVPGVTSQARTTQADTQEETSKNNMYNNSLDGVSAYIQQQVCDPQMQSTDQHDVNAENHTQVLYHTCIIALHGSWTQMI